MSLKMSRFTHGALNEFDFPVFGVYNFDAPHQAFYVYLNWLIFWARQETKSTWTS